MFDVGGASFRKLNDKFKYLNQTKNVSLLTPEPRVWTKNEEAHNFFIEKNVSFLIEIYIMYKYYENVAHIFCPTIPD